MLIAYTNSLELIRTLRPIVEQLKQRSADLADQIERAATSVAHNVGEGSRRSGKDRRRFYAMAHGSAGEILAALDVADAWGWEVECTNARAVLDRELALLWGLTH
jgi:four helix bundle protein